jgi:hypothetical protein
VSLTPTRLQEVRALFDAAVERTPETRDAFLEAGEEAQLHHARLARVERGEAGEGVVEGDDVERVLAAGAAGGGGRGLVERDAHAAVALGRPMAPRVVHQDAAHGGGGDAEEVRAALPVGVLADEAEEGLVEERGGLQRVAVALAAHGVDGEQVQLVVDEGRESLGGVGASLVELTEQLRDLVRVGSGHRPGLSLRNETGPESGWMGRR